MNRSDRAKQFMPFDGLKGFREEIKSREKIVVAKKQLSQESADELSYKIKQVKKGIVLTIVYYDNGEYLELQGIVSKISFEERYLIIVEKKIMFKDIFTLRGHEIKEYESEEY